MFQKRHINALAKALASSRPAKDDVAHYHQWLQDAMALANMIAASNPLFQRERFEKAIHE